MIELVFNGGKKSNVTGEALSIQPTQINRNGAINTEFVLVSSKASKDGKVVRKIHDLLNLASILVNQKEKVELGAINLAVGTPDWVNARRDALARALKLEKDLGDVTNNVSATTTETSNDTGADNGENSNVAPTTEGENSVVTTETQEPVNEGDNNEDTSISAEPATVEIKFVNTQNDKAFENLTWPIGELVTSMLKSLAQEEDTKEAFVSMIKSDEYKFSYWGILNEDGTDTKVDNKAVVDKNIVLKAHWKNNR